MVNENNRGAQGNPVKGSADLRGALHDVSNALTVILGWLDEVRTPGAPPEAQEAALRIIEKRARAARDLARRAIGVALTVVEEHDIVDDAVREMVTSVSVEARQAGVDLVSDLGAEDAQVLAASELSQVLGNLLLNAIAFTPTGGKVQVRSFVTASKVIVEVEDDGPGIARERATLIFEGNSSRRGGAGVGLPYARAIARANGGELALLPETAHAVFQLTWPRAGTTSQLARTLNRAIESAPLSGRTGISGLRILVLEDDRDVTALLDTALGARGAEIVIAHALGDFEAAQGRFDAVLLDISPIATRVDETMASIRKRWPKAGVVFISGTVVTGPEPHVAAGAKWVRKPFEIGEVVDAVVSCTGEEKPG